ncbi:MAG: hypothetical protein IPL65_22605 [Lewinellaceae bacterium]|nr:hypothetical protein [Lewinellaceae bacterium]
MQPLWKSFLLKIADYVRHHRSYAQDGEDVVLQSFFQDKKHYKGFFVDVGAHHPIRFSSTTIPSLANTAMVFVKAGVPTTQ